MLSKFCELKDEIKMFPSEHASKTAYELNDTDWTIKMAYLADIFTHFDELNAYFQVKNINIFKVQNKINVATLK